MFESEIYIKAVKETLPSEIVKKFTDTMLSIEKRSVLHWTEHCTECAMPACFKTCDLYSPRIDGKCQRFVQGIEYIPIESIGKINILKIYFKQWGVLESQGNHFLQDMEKVMRIEEKDIKLSSFVHLPWPNAVKKKLAKKRYGVKKKQVIEQQQLPGPMPDGFLVEIYNPSEKKILVNLTLRNEDEKYRKIPFQYLLKLEPGYNKELIPFDEIDKRIKTDLKFRISLTPDNLSPDVPLYFGLLEFVQLKNKENASNKSKKVKCVVWDLDHTLWKGVLMESKPEHLILKPDIKTIIEEIEQRGIINSIASKNYHEQAIEALKFFDLESYFIYPKISWGPKSQAIKQIAKDLNIGLDTLLFIDDSPFERKEVNENLPQVKVMDALDYSLLLELEEMNVPVTEEAKSRKKMYLEESQRKSISDQFDGEYFDFLKSCNITLELLDFRTEFEDRVYELTQRTNQMNFSGNRYEKEDIKRIAQDRNLDVYVLKATDIFGDYGIIGLGIIQKDENRLIDLMFSCRIQSKRVEHAFITFCLEKYGKNMDFFVTYKRTDKNKFSAQVFMDFGFLQASEENGIQNLTFPKDKEILNDGIIKIKMDILHEN
ncbi:HAD-IIIC family phosphatase [Pararhodonellum marinum]|uniref:HAD-IIIC family phosphatase n=1 Tax=Pararhodonellum marinum TaxID=2755358 RepID=UPI00188F347F|nr:HAD-IIIC family phosphatase [Pararhodonellum marinum]